MLAVFVAKEKCYEKKIEEWNSDNDAWKWEFGIEWNLYNGDICFLKDFFVRSNSFLPRKNPKKFSCPDEK